MAHPSHYAHAREDCGGLHALRAQNHVFPTGRGANRIAKLLRSAGIKTGDAVLFCVENCPDHTARFS